MPKKGKPIDTHQRSAPKSNPLTIDREIVPALCALIAGMLAEQLTETDLEGAFWTAWSRLASPEDVARVTKLTRPGSWD
jgi:hypothetical protein